MCLCVIQSAAVCVDPFNLLLITTVSEWDHTCVCVCRCVCVCVCVWLCANITLALRFVCLDMTECVYGIMPVQRRVYVGVDVCVFSAMPKVVSVGWLTFHTLRTRDSRYLIHWRKKILAVTRYSSQLMFCWGTLCFYCFVINKRVCVCVCVCVCIQSLMAPRLNQQ